MLQTLKTFVVDTLLADPYFGDSPGIPVLDERIKELDNEIDRAVADLGLCVFVTIPVAQVTGNAANLKGPYFDQATLVCRVFERPVLNTQNNQDGTGKTGLETAQTIASLLHLKLPDGASEPLICQRVALADDPERVAYDVVFSNRGGIKYTIPQVATPSLSVTTGTATITCATAGAAIFYTVNGNVPTPRSGTLYTAPFAVGSAVTIRTRAWLAGYTGSIETTLTT